MREMFINTMFSSTFSPSLLLSAGVHHMFNLTSTGGPNKYQKWGKLSKLSMILKMKRKKYRLHFLNPRVLREMKCSLNFMFANICDMDRRLFKSFHLVLSFNKSLAKM